MALPDRPGRLTCRPEVVEGYRVLVRVHAVPEAQVAEGVELPVGSRTAKRVGLEHARLVNPVEDTGLEAEESAVYPVIEPRLLLEAPDHPVVTKVGDAPLAQWTHHRH